MSTDKRAYRPLVFFSLWRIQLANNTAINPKVVEFQGQPITASTSVTASDTQELLLDKDWAKSSFLINDSSMVPDKSDSPDPNLNSFDIQNRYWSSADIKFTDTRLGCNIGINPRPQFTRYSDIRSAGRRMHLSKVSPTGTVGPFGMGRYYSEAIDDPAQTIYLRFGVPQFNSLLSFIRTAFDPDAIAMARTGRGTSAFYKTASLMGTVSVALAFPAVTAVVAAGKFLSWVFARPTSKFYTLKPTMHMYWGVVNTLVNDIAVNKGILPKVLNPDDNAGTKLGQPYVLDQGHMDLISNMMPDVFHGQNFFDMYAIANKAQRYANKVFMADYASINNETATDYTGYLMKQLTGDGSHGTDLTNSGGDRKLWAILANLAKFGYYTAGDKDAKMEQDPRVNDDPNTPPKPQGYWKDFWNYFDSEFDDGSQFAVFKVDHTGSVQEAFSNSAVESDLSQKVNSMSSQARSARFTFSDGNIAGETVGAVVGAAKDVVAGALDGMTFGFSSLVAGLAGSGYIDIPKHWQSSSASLPRSNYTIQLVSPYGNSISQMINIYIPLSMLLAGSLPLSTGKQSYSSPFLCQLYDRGRCQVKLGMIESLSISRGTSNLAFNTKGSALAIDVSFTVADLSSIMHMPVSNGGILSFDSGVDEDNILMDYLAVLAGQDLYSQLYAMPKAKLKLAKAIMNAQSLFSPAWLASATHESLTTGMLSYLTLGLANVYEGIARGNVMTTGSAINR